MKKIALVVLALVAVSNALAAAATKAGQPFWDGIAPALQIDPEIVTAEQAIEPTVPALKELLTKELQLTANDLQSGALAYPDAIGKLKNLTDCGVELERVTRQLDTLRRRLVVAQQRRLAVSSEQA